MSLSLASIAEFYVRDGRARPIERSEVTCLDRCQMQALSKEGDHIALNLDRCIGCWLCETTCPGGALTLRRRADTKHSRIPINMDATWREIMQGQATGKDVVK